MLGQEAKNAENPEEVLAKREEEYREKFANPYNAAEKGYIDDIIVATKKDSNPPKKHGNIPL